MGPKALWEMKTHRCIGYFNRLHPEPAPGHLHQGAFEFLGGAQITFCVSGGGDSGGKRAICDRVQLLTLAKACNHFLMCAVLLVSLSKLITFSKEGGGGHSNSFGGARPTNAPLGAGPASTIQWERRCEEIGLPL